MEVAYREEGRKPRSTISRELSGALESVRDSTPVDDQTGNPSCTALLAHRQGVLPGMSMRRLSPRSIMMLAGEVPSKEVVCLHGDVITPRLMDEFGGYFLIKSQVRSGRTSQTFSRLKTTEEKPPHRVEA